MADEIHTRRADIESTYPLSPMQQGMLFNSLSEPHSGVDIEQILCTMPEDLDVAAFRQAWENAVARHAVLRTSFDIEGGEPRQSVHRHVRVHLEQKDWRGLAGEDQTNRLDAFLNAERHRGFELTAPPLMRLALFHTGEREYTFALTYHHLLFDAATFVLLLDEVFLFYEALCHGRELQLDCPRPYRDYIDWLQKHDRAGAETFWRETLKGFTSPTPLPAARCADKQDQSTTLGHRVQQAVVSSAETARLRSIAKECGLTPGTFLQAAWAVLLSRYTGETDVTFGIVRAGRRSTIEGADSMVGLFINTLPLRVRVAPDARVRDWLKELRAQNLAIRKYEHTPLTRIHQWSEVPGGQSLFKTLFSFQDPSWDFALRAKGGKWAERRLDIRNQPNHPLWVDVYGGEELILKIGYDQNRFDDAVIARMLGHFQTVLKSMADDMAQHVGELPLLTEAERHQLFVEWNNTRADVPRGRCVHELFEAQVEIAPHAIALVHQKEAVSYWELDYQANRVANHLRSHGVGPDVPVGVCVERSIGMVVALLGILKAGGAYVPLDPAYPRERLAFMLEDSRAPALLTQSSLACDFKFETPKLKVICLESLLRGTATQPECKPRANVSPENLAYIIYTSGSTGTPKGVEITHRNLANLMTWHQWTYRVTPQDRATQLAGFSFDASVWELWPYLAAGARVCIVDNETRASASKLIHWLAEKKITLSFVPTPLAEEILQQPLRGDLALRAMLTGGDKLNRRPGTDLPFNLVNHYGPTENTVVTTFTVVAPTEGGDGAAPPIGKPISNVQVYVLDQRLRPVPIHVPGELYIGGESLARGYRNQPALTAEKFVRDPFSQDAGARLYKTGDLVRWLPDGNLEFLGRMDHQVKIRGYRIEPGEIEALLNRHPAVRESVIIATEAARGQKQLIAYLIAKGESKPGTKELADFLRTKLPDYMVPSAFVFLSAWPLTPNGKVDRNALPAPDQSSFKSSRAFVAPRNRFEGAAAKVWSEILGRTRIGIHDNFFELGGHSLLAAQAIARLNEEFKVALPVRSLFDEPTIAGLTREIEKSLDHGATRRAPALARVARDAYRVSECSPEMNAEPARKN